MINNIATIDNVKIGNGLKIMVQTMTNTKTQNIESSVEQCIKASEAGADIIRLTTQGVKEVEALKEIKRILRENKINTPLVADVHFNADVAILAAQVADKVRINPGNFAKEKDIADSKFKDLLKVCKEHNTAIRIGINHGSLGERIVSLYGNSPKGMMQAAIEWVNLCIENDFYNVVFSLKASNTAVMVEAYRLLDKEFKKTGISFPLHLGITEAGNGEMGRIKSAVGIGTLLKERIGNTLRISLTENPVNEILPGKILAEYYNPSFKTADKSSAGTADCNTKSTINSTSDSNAKNKINSVSTYNNVAEGFAVAEIFDKLLNKIGKDNNISQITNNPVSNTDTICKDLGIDIKNGLLYRCYRVNSKEEFIIKAASDFGSLLLDKKIDDFNVDAFINNIKLDDKEISEFKENLLQAARRRFFHPEYIACPGCGRTLYNLEETFNKVKEKTYHLKDIKIAIMGCIVNGPGEMADADFGYVGEGAGKVTLYKGKEIIAHGIHQEEAIDKLLELIENNRN